MRIAAMAAGAIGGYFGARLADAGHDVFFIARGANLAAIKADGLKIESPVGDLHLKNVNATDNPKDVGPVDIVLFAVKLWDTEAAAELTKSMVGPGTRVITLQNGVDSVERLAPILGAEHVVGGTTQISTTIAGAGVIRHHGAAGKMTFGHEGRRPDPVLEAFAAACRAAKLNVELSPDIRVERWHKFISLSAMSGATSALRATLGQIRSDPETFAFLRQLMEECVAIGRAEGVDLDPAFVDSRLDALMTMDPGMRASMSRDLEHGNRLELDWLGGHLRQLGRKHGIPTPANDTVWTVLKLHRMGTRA